jgi:hypothetical protein
VRRESPGAFFFPWNVVSDQDFVSAELQSGIVGNSEAI